MSFIPKIKSFFSQSNIMTLIVILLFASVIYFYGSGMIELPDAITSLLSILALIVIFQTLQEMKRQRIHAYQPEIALKVKNNIRIYYTDSYPLSGIWVSGQKDPKELRFKQNEKLLMLNNVGRGVLKISKTSGNTISILSSNQF